MKLKAFLWLPVLFWAGTIFYFSSIPNLRVAESNFWDEIIRSGAHFVLYGLGYFLFFRALNWGKKKKTVFWPLILTFLYGISDEVHQSFVPTRSFQLRDLLVDFLGVFGGVLTSRLFSVKKKTMKIGRLIIILLGLVIFSFFSSFGGEVSAQNPLERKIIVFKSGILNEPAREALLQEFGGIKIKDLTLIDGMAVLLPPGAEIPLLSQPGVLRVDPDVEVYALPRKNRVDTAGICDRFPNWRGCQPTPTPTSAPTTDGASQTLPWGVSRISADDAWSVSSGSGVKVAVVDTGIDRDHPDLDANLAGCLNFIQPWKTCEDDNGHGTHVSGIIAAENNNIGVVGVAPNAKIYALKVLNRRGSGYLSDIIEALDWAVQNGVQVVNMSLGTSSNVVSFHEAVQRVNAAGIIQVAAAGNSGPGANTVIYPAKYPEVIAVSATDSNDQVPSWSSRGPEVDLAGPGVSVYSTYKGNTYKTLSGTSMSSPHVAGVVALRLEDHPGDNPSTMESVLEANTDSLPFDPTMVGAGLVNAYKVVSAP